MENQSIPNISNWIAEYSSAFLNNKDKFIIEHNLDDRLFYFDAFISHKNPDKLAKYLTITLAKRGLYIWHDTICGIYSNNIVNNISKSLRDSRFIFVMLNSENKKLSNWVKAEILPTLFFEKDEKDERIIVIQEEKSVVVPKELINHRRFCLWKGESEILKIANFLKEHNNGKNEDELRFRQRFQYRRPLIYKGKPHNNLVDDLLNQKEIQKLNHRRLDFLISRIKFNKGGLPYFEKLKEENLYDNISFELFFRDVSGGVIPDFCNKFKKENLSIFTQKDRESMKSYYSYLRKIIDYPDKKVSAAIFKFMWAYLYDQIFLPLVYFKDYEVFSVNGLKKNYFKILTISKSSLEYFEEGTKPYNKFKEDIERFKNEFDLQNHLTSIL